MSSDAYFGFVVVQGETLLRQVNDIRHLLSCCLALKLTRPVGIDPAQRLQQTHTPY
jgi:hypothetical protein